MSNTLYPDHAPCSSFLSHLADERIDHAEMLRSLQEVFSQWAEMERHVAALTLTVTSLQEEQKGLTEIKTVLQRGKGIMWFVATVVGGLAVVLAVTDFILRVKNTQ